MPAAPFSEPPLILGTRNIFVDHVGGRVGEGEGQAPMTPAERSAAVAALADIITASWTRQQAADDSPIADGEGETR